MSGPSGRLAKALSALVAYSMIQGQCQWSLLARGMVPISWKLPGPRAHGPFSVAGTDGMVPSRRGGPCLVDRTGGLWALGADREEVGAGEYHSFPWLKGGSRSQGLKHRLRA